MNQKALRAGFFLGILLDFFIVTVYPNKDRREYIA